MTSTVTIECPGPTATETPVKNKSFATTDNTAAAYTTGVTLTGTTAQAWKNFLPDSTSSPYRKITVV